MNEQAIKDTLSRLGWEFRKQGYFYKTQRVNTPTGVVERQFRVKFNKHSLAVQMHSSVNSFWIRIGGCSFDAVRRNPDGTLQIISYKLT